ncbi:hypothetical protein [Cucumibacter marinus]|uniref:hypothetical protein n=1 Tax=Cucumibacter marinus TaxID=1121252 RepID=UPI00041BBDE3|nr:hypothetical protein [Cucumibacter marinus]
MTRLILLVVVFAVLFFGIRAIARSFSDYFKTVDDDTRKRDRAESKRPDVIELKRDEDGVYRPRSGDETNKDDERRG